MYRNVLVLVQQFYRNFPDAQNTIYESNPKLELCWIFKQSMEAGQETEQEQGCRTGSPEFTRPGGIGSLESILGLLKSLKIRAQEEISQT
jgi:hypothetical protein